MRGNRRLTLRPAHRPRDAKRPGFTLAELMVALTISALLTVLAVPRFDAAIETTKADQAAQSLRSIWNAQRLYRLEHGSYADSIADLGAEDLVDLRLQTVSQPYSFRVVEAGRLGFRAAAERQGSSVWHGTLTIDETGTLGGAVEDAGGRDATPFD